MGAIEDWSIPDVVAVEVLRGSTAPADARPRLLVEVPHGADRRSHYDALRARLVGELPDDLDHFFSFNTDVAAFALGRRTAEKVLQRRPELSVLVVRSLVPRTFIDCNRPADFGGGDLNKGGLTAGIPSYVTDARDIELLRDLHQRYVEVAERGYDLVCGGGGLALCPHTYGPRSLGIAKVDAHIVEELHRAHEPELYETWPVRPEVDLLTRDKEGKLWAPPGLEETLLEAFQAAGYAAQANVTYHLVEGTMGWVFSTKHEGRVLALEVRRDLLVDWTPFSEMVAIPGRVERFAEVLATALADHRGW